jgi:hypothetical protein
MIATAGYPLTRAVLVIQTNRVEFRFRSFPAEVSSERWVPCVCARVYVCVCGAVIGGISNTGSRRVLRKVIAVSTGRAILFPRADVIYLDDRAIYPSLLVADCYSRGGPEAPSLKKN